jgi:hypothetical protein
MLFSPSRIVYSTELAYLQPPSNISAWHTLLVSSTKATVKSVSLFVASPTSLPKVVEKNRK